MAVFVPLLGVAAVAAGVVMVAAAAGRPRVRAAAVLAGLDGPVHDAPLDAFTEHLSQPLGARLLLPAGRRIARGIGSLLPGNRLAFLRKRIAQAGLEDTYTPEDFYAVQAVAAGAGALAGTLLGLAGRWGGGGSLRAALVAGAIAGAAPRFKLNRRIEGRQAAMRRDLPDILDLLAISVEAGVGLEGAVEVVTHHFDSPLAHELGRMLREMELGLSRREALANLKRRCEVPDVSNFVLSLIQADALGMPLGRVLRIQANEMRQKRRQWAREKAAKLPVKIIFPMLTFIFPALFVVILGPALISIMENIL